MVFTTTNLFKGIPCPKGDACRLTQCIFSHDGTAQPTQNPEIEGQSNTPTAIDTQSSKRAADTPSEPDAKRRKVTYESLDAKPPSRAERIKDQLAQLKSRNQSSPKTPNSEGGEAKHDSVRQPTSLTRPVSPPGTSNKAIASSQTTANGSTNSKHSETTTKPKVDKVETLNPRKIPRDPAGHDRRTLYLKHLHGAMGGLNAQVATSTTLTPERKRLFLLEDQDLIKFALDVEEKFAREQGPGYGNLIKNKIAAFKKMKEDDWIKYFSETRGDPEQKSSKKQPRVIDTGLSSSEELLLLPRLVADQKPLAAHGYIISPPTRKSVAESAAAVEAGHYYEICDRCSTRFQAFPERNEEGLLSTNGPCKYHAAKRVFPNRTKGDPIQREAYHPCCNENVGTPGCTTHPSHVYRHSNPARLATVTPFINTPENGDPAKTKSGKDVGAVTFDCEMGYTSRGFELLRLTAITWPLGEELLDVLVRPRGTIIDLNSRYSGVFPEHYANAIAYEQYNDIEPAPLSSPDPGAVKPPDILPVVPSPEAARDLLCSYLTPSTPLIGHGLENDLNAARFCHPTIVDTILLFPHPKGLPLRFGLKKLTAQYLHRDIQTGGDRGHDSLEDSRATGDLARYKVGEIWRNLKGSGWKIEGGELISSKSEANLRVEKVMKEAKEEARLRGVNSGSRGDGEPDDLVTPEETDHADASLTAQ